MGTPRRLTSILLIIVSSTIVIGCSWPAREPINDLAALEAKAESGDAEAQYNLGKMYFDRILRKEGVPQDYAKVFEWYQRSAQQGNIHAQAGLGYLYLYGLGVSKDYAKSAEWYQKAAKQGDRGAQYALRSVFPDFGSSVLEDYSKETFEWSKKAAEQGNSDAQFDLGMMYYEGKGIPQDYAKAFEWLKKAAEHGDAEAQSMVGGMCVAGQGVNRDFLKAAEWQRKAAIQGNGTAQYNYGLMYMRGIGVPEDKVLAYAWINLAAARGSEKAPEYRNEIKLKPADLAEAQRLSSGWKSGEHIAREGRSVPDLPDGPIDIKEMTVLEGECRLELIVGFLPCESKVVWNLMSNDSANISFLKEEYVYTLSGRGDRQPNLEDYYQRVDTILIAKDGKPYGRLDGMEGECHFRVNKSGSKIFSIRCEPYNRSIGSQYKFYLENIKTFDRKVF